ncbi:hypothetical protein HQ865_00795 [Mucilaginibacter mali]|uniref:Uncharacterized protein n=1 Tax=Mucilaginibacter mali TaxID=2740462 RepID=A0A7D4UDZ7_9SPHI|nr:hypothetical protein [Mucilaginibacter mali]QKJ28356.1 hypothetical protein HQ865_00795 [Mucilaginibacter mali]
MRTKFYPFARFAIRRRANHPRVMEALQAERKTYHNDNIQTSYKRKSIKLNRYGEELETRISKNDEHLISTDKWGIERNYEAPILKPNEVATASRDRYSWTVVTFILLIFDSYFASMIVPYILPISQLWLKFILGACIAILIILCCEAGFKNLALYFEGRLLLKKGELSEDDKPRVIKRLVVAIGFITAGVFATFTIAMVRLIFLEAVDVAVNNHSAIINQLNSKLNSGSKYAAAATFVLAFIVIGLFAFYSLQKNKYATRYKLYKKYHKNARRINKLINRINKINSMFWHTVKDNLEAAWSLMLHIRRILKRTVDEENKAKEAEFHTVSARDDFEINDNVYRQFEKVACCNRELFLYGIDESKEVRAIKLSWNTMMIKINTMIELYKSTHQYNSKPIKKAVSVPNGVNAVILVLGLLFFASCNNSPKSINMVAFVDLSSSINSDVKDYYLKIIRSLLDDLTPGSSLKVLPLDGSTEKGSTEFINVSIPPKSTFENELDPPSQKLSLEKMRFEAFKDSVIKVVDVGIKAISPSSRNVADRLETDVLGAFRLLSKYQDTSSKTTKNTVLFLSDMLNCNRELDIEHHSYNEEKQQLIIAKIKKEDLSTWQVFVLTGQSKVTSVKYLSTKQFWSDYLEQSKNKGLIYESGATSLIFSKIKELTKPDPDKFSFLN